MLLQVTNISKSFAQQDVLKDISFKISQGDRIGLVGANGAGKTTLFKIILKKLAQDKGEVIRKKSFHLLFTTNFSIK